ncbi:hypothetical protein FXO38_07542 [Capsicum annuum]|nr:hypothetical protein FXO38_07542 [Capsicum annuum]
MASSSSSNPPLPSDIIFKILTQTSLRTVDTCKAVNKEWRDLTYESSFMPQFCARSKNISGYFVQSLVKHRLDDVSEVFAEFVSMDGCSGNNTTTPFRLPIDDEQVKPRRSYDFRMKIVASSMQGFLCCVRTLRYNDRYYICKPTTKQWFKLPNPKTRYSTVKVALIVLRSIPLHFKIIRLSSPSILYHHSGKKLGLHCYCSEVFDSERWEWRQGKDLLFPRELYFDWFPPVVNANGLIYFKLNQRDNQDHKVMALNYNGEEIFPRFSLPKPPFDEYQGYYPFNQLVEYKGKLGFTHLSPKGMKLWIFENRNHHWELKTEVDTEAVKAVTSFPIPKGFFNEHIALLLDSYEAIFYDLQDKSINKVKLNKCHDVQEIFPFRSDLEPVDLRMPTANTISTTKSLYRPSYTSFTLLLLILLCGILWFSHA